MKKICLILIHLLAATFCNSQIITTIAGNGISGYSDSILAASASINNPCGIIIDADGSIIFSDNYNNVVQKIDTNGIIHTIAGNGIEGYGGDFGPALQAMLGRPVGLAEDKWGNIYIADVSNDRIRKVDANTGIITTIAGSNISGYYGDNGPADSASLRFPTGVAVDTFGNIYIADQGNQRIRKVDYTNGTITTIAGIGGQGYSGDGTPAILAEIGKPYDLRLDKSGNIIFSDVFHVVIRKIDRVTGLINTIAGRDGQPGFIDGNATDSATFNGPEGIAIDNNGDIFIADLYAYRVRKLDLVNNTITTVAGSGSMVSNGDGGLATLAGMWPSSVAVSGNKIFITDINHRIRMIDNSTISNLSFLTGGGEPLLVIPNPVNERFKIQNVLPNSSVAITDITGESILYIDQYQNDFIDARNILPGIYLIRSCGKELKFVKM